MIEKLTDYLIKRRLRKERIPIVESRDTTPEILQFRRVLNTLRENSVMVSTEKDGIYIRMAGDVKKGEAFSLEWAKVISF